MSSSHGPESPLASRLASRLAPPPSFDSLSPQSLHFLQQIPDYPLDFNIFVFRGIHDTRAEIADELAAFRSELDASLPILKAQLTSTSALQDRLLQILIIERHRRDIELLNGFINSDNSTKADLTTGKSSPSIKPISLSRPLAYDIKSPIYRQLQANKASYQDSFKKFAILQNLEFDFELLSLSDEELIAEFLSDEVLNFNESYLKGTEQDELELRFEQIFKEGRFIRVVVPLAAQSILMGKGEEEEGEDKEDEEGKDEEGKDEEGLAEEDKDEEDKDEEN